jgi:hypothetical protein
MVLKVGLTVSFGNIQDYKGIWEKAGKINSMEAYVTNVESTSGIHVTLL